ncbi:MAG: hypothetical protein AAF801_14360 [Pseudomonadota bacterium]
MGKRLADYTAAEKRLISKTAKRKVNSEVSLILGGGFALLMIVFFLLGKFTFLPLAEMLNLRPTLVWVGLSFGLAIVWAITHYRTIKPTVMQAQEIDAAFLYEYQAKLQAERKRKHTGADQSSDE